MPIVVVVGNGGDPGGGPVSPPQPDPNRSFNITLIGPNDKITLTTRAGAGNNGEPPGVPPLMPGFFLGRGTQGLDLPPVDLFSDPFPGDDGDYYRSMRNKLREVFLPILVSGPSQPAARDAQRRLFALLNPRQTDGLMLDIGQYDGTTRRLYCRYAGGAEGDWGSGWFKWWSKMGITLRAFDPYFYDTVAVESEFVLESTASPLVGTSKDFFPITLSASDVDFTDVPVSNKGDVEAFPVWTITGPTASGLEIGLNGESEKLFTLGAIASGEVVTVTTARAYQSVVDQTTNRWTLLQPGSYLWSLPPGDSSLRISGSGFDVDTKVQLSFTPRYLAA
jgi:hypothetical protein